MRLYVLYVKSMLRLFAASDGLHFESLQQAGGHAGVFVQFSDSTLGEVDLK